MDKKINLIDTPFLNCPVYNYLYRDVVHSNAILTYDSCLFVLSFSFLASLRLMDCLSHDSCVAPFVPNSDKVSVTFYFSKQTTPFTRGWTVLDASGGYEYSYNFRSCSSCSSCFCSVSKTAYLRRGSHTILLYSQQENGWLSSEYLQIKVGSSIIKTYELSSYTSVSTFTIN